MKNRIQSILVACRAKRCRAPFSFFPIMLLVQLFVMLMAANAFALDMRGDWIVNLSGGNQGWRIETQNDSLETFSGFSASTTAGNTQLQPSTRFGDINGSYDGNSIVITNPYTNGANYSVTFIGAVNNEGTVATGTWASSRGGPGQSGNFTAVLISRSLAVEGSVRSRDDTEKGVSGVTINLTGTTTDGAAVSKTATTDINGRYSIAVDKGSYTVQATGEGDYTDRSEIKKENGGKFSATGTGTVCDGSAAEDTCHLNPLVDTNLKAQFVYTLCAQSERVYKGKSQTHCPIVFVPGFLGSRIVCEGGVSTLWPAIPQQWGQMYLQADGETNETTNGACNQSTNPLPGRDGLVATIGPSSEDVYQSTIDFLDAEAPGRWWASPYDWRKPPPLGRVKLESVVDTALESTGAKFVTLYGHSMGGLVIRDYLNDSSHVGKVARIMTAGTPYWGAPKSHFALLGGYFDTPNPNFLDYAFTRADLQRLARNLGGLFYLYPSSEFGSWLGLANATFDSFQTQSEGGEDDWMQSLGANPRLLDNARAWHAANDGFPENDIDYHIVVGAGSATVLETKIRAPRDQSPFGTIVFGNGDSTVPLRSATQNGSESGITFGKNVPVHYACGVSHVALPGHPDVTAGIRQFLLAGEAVTGLDNKCPYSGVAILVAQVNLGGGNTDITVLAGAPTEVRRRSDSGVSVRAAAAMGLVQVFPVGNTLAIVVDDANPATVKISGKNVAVQVQTIGDTGDGPIVNYSLAKIKSILIGASTESVSALGGKLVPVKIVKKAPTTTPSVVKNGKKATVTLKAKGPNGVLGTFYRLTKTGTPIKYTRPVKIKIAALKKFGFYSIDSYGQSEKWRALPK